MVSLPLNASARSSPLALNHNAVYSTPGFALKPTSTASASAQPGTRRGLTSEHTWMCLRPVSASASMSLILSAVLMGPGSIWKPSRGPSSWISACVGRSVMVAPLVHPCHSIRCHLGDVGDLDPTYMFFAG